MTMRRCAILGLGCGRGKKGEHALFVGVFVFRVIFVAFFFYHFGARGLRASVSPVLCRERHTFFFLHF